MTFNSSDLAQKDEDALLTNAPLVIDADYAIDADIRVQSPVVYTSGRFLIEAGKRLYLEGGMEAPETQVFEYTDRTSRAYIKSHSVKATWWGLTTNHDGASFIKKDNHIPLQYAHDSVAGSLFDPSYPLTWEGGTITVPQGYCLMQEGVVNHGFTICQGASRGTIFTPDVDGWTGNTDYLFKFYREAAGVGVSQFNSRLENCRIWGKGFSGINHMVLAWSPQEQSGWKNVHFDAVYKNAITYQFGYGGAAMVHIDQCEFWMASNAHPNAHLIDFESPGFIDNWMILTIKDSTFAAHAAAHEQVGVMARGRFVTNIVGAVHFENIKYGILLTGQSCLSGEMITGGSDVPFLISTDSWQKGIGFIDIGVRKGSSAVLYKDWATGSATTTDVQYGRLRVG